MSENIENNDVSLQTKTFEEPNGEPTCKINFENNPNRVYYTGPVVNGCVNLTINEAVTVRSIYANIVGRGYCMWTTYSGKRSITNMKEEFYLNRKIYYIGSRNDASGRILVQPGEYKYLFDCTIPDECHTSIEEGTAFIRYSVTVVIEEDDDKRMEFVESFTVLNPLNLNDDETLSYPMSDEAEFIFNKYCCCCCCSLTEPVKISAKVPMKGFVPGQNIEININVDNKSDQKYDNFTGNFFKKIEFYANDKTHTTTEKLTTFNCEGCPAGETLSRKLIVTVPSTAPTEKSNICSISYELTVEAFADSCRDDCKLVFPITIGSYPIQTANATGDIVVTQQPTKGLSNGHNLEDVQLHNKLTEQTQLQPLLKEVPDGNPNLIVPPGFRVGESSRSDKDLESPFRPMYPTYASTQYPLTFTLKVEAGEVKPIKM